MSNNISPLWDILKVYLIFSSRLLVWENLGWSKKMANMPFFFFCFLSAFILADGRLHMFTITPLSEMHEKGFIGTLH